MQRPTSVTVIAWVIIALAAEGIVGSATSLFRPVLSQIADPRVGVPTTMLLGSMIQVAAVVSAIFMLRGANAARIVYAVLAGVMVFGGLVSTLRLPAMAPIGIFTIIKAAIFLYVLFRAEANAYFSGSAAGYSLPGPRA